MFEIHIIELRKKLEGSGRLDDWIRLFNARTGEDIKMIKSNNPGIIEAIREIKVMGLGKSLRWPYEMRMKEIRDRNARDAYVRDEGIAIGESRGMRRGEQVKLINQVRKKINKSISVEETAAMLEEEISLIAGIYDIINAHPKWNDEKVCRTLESEYHEESLS